MTNVENVIDPDNGQDKNKMKYFQGKTQFLMKNGQNEKNQITRLIVILTMITEIVDQYNLLY